MTAASVNSWLQLEQLAFPLNGASVAPVKETKPATADGGAHTGRTHAHASIKHTNPECESQQVAA